MPPKTFDHNGSSAKADMSVSRRTLMKAGLGVTAAGFLLRGRTLPAFAKDNPALGTFPAGTTGSSVFVGGVMPLTGPYSSSGKDMQLGFELAIDHLNNGSRVTEQIPTLKKGKGVLGKKIEFQVADSETKPDTAIQAATRFIRDNKAIMLTGGISSAVSIAMQKLGTARARHLHGRQQRLQRHHRQGLPAIRLPRPAVGLYGREGASAGARQGARQRPQGRLPGARLHLRPQRLRLDEGVHRKSRMEDGGRAARAARHHGLSAPTSSISPTAAPTSSSMWRSARTRSPRPSRPSSSAS